MKLNNLFNALAVTTLLSFFMGGAHAQSFQRCQGNQVPNCFELSQSEGQCVNSFANVSGQAYTQCKYGPATQGGGPFVPNVCTPSNTPCVNLPPEVPGQPAFPQNKRY